MSTTLFPIATLYLYPRGERVMMCAHCKQPIVAGDEMTLHGCASAPEKVCLPCWIAATLPFDCLQCVAETTGGRIG